MRLWASTGLQYHTLWNIWLLVPAVLEQPTTAAVVAAQEDLELVLKMLVPAQVM
jgi:hypothetical protein